MPDASGRRTQEAMTVTYEQPIHAHYECIISAFLREGPPEGWSWAQLTLPIDERRIDTRTQQEEFVRELIKLIRDRTSVTTPERASKQGFWIEDFGSPPVLDAYLRGGILKIFPGERLNKEQPYDWIQVFP
jgi:hypothetical protein